MALKINKIAQIIAAIGPWSLTALLLLFCCGIPVSSAIADSGNYRVMASSYFPERPEEISSQRWVSLQAAVEEAKLRPSPNGIGGEDGQFGYSISVSGNRALIGNISNGGSGAAVVFENSDSGWIESAILRPSNSEQGDEFGFSVSLLGDRALVGAPGDDFRSGSAYVFDFNGTAWIEASRLVASDGEPPDAFGYSVSLSHDLALVGSRFDDDMGAGSGSAYVFQFNGSSWSESSKLLASDGEYGDHFGHSVSLSENRALVSARSDDDNGDRSGSAYVFDFDGTSWSETAKLTASDGTALDVFGHTVSLSGNRVLIGAHGDGDDPWDSGSAYVFDFDGTFWNETAKLTASDAARNQFFGYSVSLSGDRALIGAIWDEDNGQRAGSAYVFEFNGTTWIETEKLVAIQGLSGVELGYSVSLSGDRALVGAPFDDENGRDSGAAFVFDFDKSTWSEEAKLIPSEGASRDLFGYSVSLCGDRAVVGAPFDDLKGKDSGSAYIFEFNGSSWIESVKLTADDAQAGDQFGYSVALSGNRILVGALRNDGSAVNTGSVYVFDYKGSTWTETAKLLSSDTGRYAFGFSVVLMGDRALVGELLGEGIVSGSGAVYVFDFDGIAWNETAKLFASDGANNDKFGYSVSLSGDRVLIGVPNDDDNGSESGSAYVFEYSGISWTEKSKLTPSDGENSDFFGSSVSLSGSWALIGAPEDDDNGSFSGSVYAFYFDGLNWVEAPKLMPSDGDQGDNFGWSVSVFGNRALIGANNSEYGIAPPGSAYVFDFDGLIWNETMKLSPSDGAIDDWFGTAVTFSDELALISAIQDDDHGTSSGSVYVFDLGLLFKDNFETEP